MNQELEKRILEASKGSSLSQKEMEAQIENSKSVLPIVIIVGFG